MKSHDELMFYTQCWLELRSFLLDVVRDKSSEFPFADDVLHVMSLIERKFDRC